MAFGFFLWFAVLAGASVATTRAETPRGNVEIKLLTSTESNENFSAGRFTSHDVARLAQTGQTATSLSATSVRFDRPIVLAEENPNHAFVFKLRVGRKVTFHCYDDVPVVASTLAFGATRPRIVTVQSSGSYPRMRGLDWQDFLLLANPCEATARHNAPDAGDRTQLLLIRVTNA